MRRRRLLRTGMAAIEYAMLLNESRQDASIISDGAENDGNVMRVKITCVVLELHCVSTLVPQNQTYRAPKQWNGFQARARGGGSWRTQGDICVVWHALARAVLLQAQDLDRGIYRLMKI